MTDRFFDIFTRYDSSRPAKLLSRAGGGATEAWWYENTNSIDVFIYTPGKDAVSCRIQRQQLKSWLSRTERRTKK